MEKKKIEAFKTLFGFDFTDFDSMYEISSMTSLFKTLEEAREVKKAYEILKEEFGWEVDFSIYKYYNGLYSIESPDTIVGDLEKIEQ